MVEAGARKIPEYLESGDQVEVLIERFWYLLTYHGIDKCPFYKETGRCGDCETLDRLKIALVRCFDLS